MNKLTREVALSTYLRFHLWKIVTLSLFMASAPYTEFWIELLQYRHTWWIEGELWRLLTAHWIHGSWSHWWLNLVALLVFFILLGSYLTYREFITIFLLSALSISLGLYFFTEYYYYVGFSAALYGIFIYTALNAMQQGQLWFGLTITLYITGKILFDSLNGASELTEKFVGLPVVTESHLLGMLSGYIANIGKHIFKLTIKK